MFDRIVMNIVDMPIHIILISNNVIPESSLPKFTAIEIVALTVMMRKGQLDSAHQA